MRRFASLTLGTIAVVTCVQMRAQSDGKPIAFEAASIKLDRSGEEAIGGGGTVGTEYRVTNIPARVLIEQAYGVRQRSQLVRGPSWLSTDRFDIVGKMPRPDLSRMAMVRTLLAQRFKLVTHTEARQLPIYALVVARNDRRLGPSVHPSNCVSGKQPDGKPCVMKPGFGSFSGTGVDIPRFITSSLASAVDRPIVDRTGLTGLFDIDLHWVADPTAVAATTDAPDIFTALQEQLGLKLEPTTGPVDVIVIDHVERPTEN